MTAESQRAWVRHVAPIVVVVLAAIALGFLPPRPRGSIDLLTDWQYRLSDRASTTELGEPWESPRFAPLALPAHPGGEGRVLWLRTRLPAAQPPDAVVAIDAVTGPFEAYIDEARAFVYPEPAGLEARGPVGVPWQVIPLPPGSEGKVFTLRIAAEYRPMGVKGTPLHGSRADLLRWTLDRDVSRLVVGLVAMLMGLLGLLSFTRRESWRVPLGFFIWSTSIGVYVVHYTHLKDLLVDMPRVSFFAWMVALPLMCIGALLFLGELFAQSPRRTFPVLLRLNLVAAGIYAVGMAVAFALSVSPDHLPRAVWLFAAVGNGLRIVILVSSLLVLVEILRLSVAGNWDARIYLVGYVLMLAFIVRDVMAAFGAALLSWKSQLHVGVLACGLAMAILLQRRHVAVHEQARRYAEQAAERAREKELLLRDLHDGIGALSSNILMLAEVGRKSDVRARQALSTIGELARKSLAELRAFVQTLDDETISWESHAAELRRFGATLVEAHGRTFEMEVDLDTASPPPTLLSLHMLRIFNEALTNALKRPDGSYVKVSLEVRPNALRFSVKNDGEVEPGSGRGIGAGRGIENLRARARELGGDLSVDIGEVTCLVLRVPLPLKSPDAAAPALVA